MQPRVSVVMIFLNAESFIEPAIESVRAQTCREWELLLVDDGSTDRSTQIAQRYAAALPEKIRYMEHAGHANRGTGISRNAGIAAARGEYVAFLDADDLYLPERLERHMQVFAANPTLGLIISSDLYWHSWRQEVDPLDEDEVIGVWAQPEVIIEPPRLLRTILSPRGGPMPATCGITFRRDLALAAGGIPAEFLDQYEDQVLISQLLLKSRVWVLDDCLAKYRQHRNSLTARAKVSGEYRPGRAHGARFVFLRWLQDFARREGIDDAVLQKALHRQLWPTRHPRLNRIYEMALDIRRWSRLSLQSIAQRMLSPAGFNKLSRLLKSRRENARAQALRSASPRQDSARS